MLVLTFRCIILQPQTMTKQKATYSIVNKVAAVLMMLTLVWLTICTPFVMQMQERLSKQSLTAEKASFPNGSEEESTGFPGSNTDEKAPNGLTNLAEEFLHHHSSHQHLFSQLEKIQGGESTPIYTAFHGELLVPPPNA